MLGAAVILGLACLLSFRLGRRSMERSIRAKFVYLCGSEEEFRDLLCEIGQKARRRNLGAWLEWEIEQEGPLEGHM